MEHKKGRGPEGPRPGGAFGGASAEALLVNELLTVGGEDVRETGPGSRPSGPKHVSLPVLLLHVLYSLARPAKVF